MTIPSLLLGLIIALLIATMYHFIRGGSGWRLLLFCGLSLVGFFLAHWLSKALGWGLYQIGGLETGLGVVGSVVSLVIGEWLLKIQPNKKSGV